MKSAPILQFKLRGEEKWCDHKCSTCPPRKTQDHTQTVYGFLQAEWTFNWCPLPAILDFLEPYCTTRLTASGGATISDFTDGCSGCESTTSFAQGQIAVGMRLETPGDSANCKAFIQGEAGASFYYTLIANSCGNKNGNLRSCIFGRVLVSADCYKIVRCTWVIWEGSDCIDTPVI